MRQRMASQDTGERVDLGQDEVPSSTEIGKQEIKVEVTQICVHIRWAQTKKFLPTSLCFLSKMIIIAASITNVPGT